ncbi:hypothetical protein [uncultured Psychrobacter sp.]|uniref:hypothetical protein n=1 Tax=uncultured Psychrobacter sp. TaxID=259303 RepID=UPI001EE13ABF|nr:hypothetical protein [Psychrobacter sp. Ps5]MCG3860172.1 hypothetical protein [Psychrobacter sp. Ps5]
MKLQGYMTSRHDNHDNIVSLFAGSLLSAKFCAWDLWLKSGKMTRVLTAPFK